MVVVVVWAATNMADEIISNAAAKSEMRLLMSLACSFLGSNRDVGQAFVACLVMRRELSD